jgi:trehalose/maltose hydrolase-like predicted phosphorylase
VARISLRFAIEAALLLNLPYSPSWSYVAERLVIVFNQTLQYHPEFQGYPLGQRIKQADAVLLGFPLNEPMEPQVRRNDLDYYGAYTRHDGTLTDLMFSLILAVI